MTKNELFILMEDILEDSRVGILAAIDNKGRPHMRWMTPTLIKGRTDVIFTVCAPIFREVVDLDKHPNAEWMIQTKMLDKIVILKGRINILDNPSIASEVFENIGSRLTIFWHPDLNQSDFLVLEMIIEDGLYSLPTKGTKVSVPFT